MSMPPAAIARESARPSVLWWGRFDPQYARNAILRSAFDRFGWTQTAFRPHLSRWGHLEAALAQAPSADLVWVPCFRQRDVLAGARYAKRIGARLCVDPLISAYDKQVNERAKFDSVHPRARRLLDWERHILSLADRVIADTPAHADYFVHELKVAADRVSVVPVGADETHFRASAMPPSDGGVDALFYGSYLPLQGPTTVVQAAQHLTRTDITLTLLGDGPLRDACERLAAGDTRVRFEPWLDYAELPARVAAAHVLFGAFGATAKANRVIPNKVYQSLACARPVLTRSADAYPRALADSASPGLTFVPADDARALAGALEQLAGSEQSLAQAGAHARAVYDAWFSGESVRSALADALDALFPDRTWRSQSAQ